MVLHDHDTYMHDSIRPRRVQPKNESLNPLVSVMNKGALVETGRPSMHQYLFGAGWGSICHDNDGRVTHRGLSAFSRAA